MDDYLADVIYGSGKSPNLCPALLALTEWNCVKFIVDAVWTFA
jgi:hypothetical protein